MALVQHLLVRQHVFCNHAGVTAHVGKIDIPGGDDRKVRRRRDGPHPWERGGFAGVDATNTGVGMGTAQNHAVQHPSQLDISPVFRSAGDFVQAVVTNGAGTQHPVVACGLTHCMGRGRHTASPLFEVRSALIRPSLTRIN